MKKFLKIFKKKKVYNFLKNYKYIYICRTSRIDKINLKFIGAVQYNLKLNPIFYIFKGQGSLLFLCFNDYITFKTIRLKTFLDPILIKADFIFSSNKLNKIFKLSSVMHLNLFIINFIFFIVYNKIKNYFLTKNIIFYRYLSF